MCVFRESGRLSGHSAHACLRRHPVSPLFPSKHLLTITPSPFPPATLGDTLGFLNPSSFLTFFIYIFGLFALPHREVSTTPLPIFLSCV